MTSTTDDKPVRPPDKQNSESRQDKVVPLMPRIREKAAGRPAGDVDEDDPGPNAA